MEPYLLTLMYFVVAVAIILIGILLFEMLTKRYKDWDEIKSGNRAVALSVGGKIVGISIILAFAIYSSITVWQTAIWGGFGIVLQLIAYLLFELLTRKFSVEEELHKGNMAVAIISFAVSVGLAFVIGASIT